MWKKRTVVALCIALLIIVSTGVACAPMPDMGQEQDAASTSEPPVSAVNDPPADVFPADADGSQLTDECGTAPDDTSLPDGNGVSPSTADSDGAGNIEPQPPSSTPAPSSTPQPPADPTPGQAEAPPSASTPQPPSTPAPTPMPDPTPAPTPQPTPDPPHQSRTICNICGADITGNVPAHGDGHLLNGEDFSYRVE